MSDLKKHKLGWIGIGRMGYAMAERLAKAGCDIAVYNRTREKAEPLAKYGAKIVGRPADLAACDIVFTMVSTGDDVKEVLEGKDGVLAGTGKPKMIVDSTSISIEASAEIRKSLAARGVKLLAAPVSRNAKVIKAGKLTYCISGPAEAFEVAKPYLDVIGAGVSYVGEGELSRIAKIAHNVFLAVTIQSLAEVTILARRPGCRARPSSTSEQERDGLDVHEVQDAGAREPRHVGDLHAGAPAQGHRPRPRRGQGARGADAAHRDHARPGADAHRQRLWRGGLRGAHQAPGEGFGHRAQAGNVAVGDGLSS
jgi:3-hydroxyisobutyrate dehydrogenase-like beta-hydroxyacid dehydrogenase